MLKKNISYNESVVKSEEGGKSKDSKEFQEIFIEGEESKHDERVMVQTQDMPKRKHRMSNENSGTFEHERTTSHSKQQ